MRVIIIDDEFHSRENLKALLREHCPQLELIGEADGVESGFQLIRQLKPQAIFLDIAMQDGSGFDLLDRFDHFSFQVIFQTAFDNFAIKAFRYHALDYLLKPVDIDDLKKAVARLSSQAEPTDLTQQLTSLLELNRKQHFEKIVLTAAEGLHFVELNDIIRLQSEGNYTTFFLDSGERIVVTKTLKNFENLLATNGFFRTHQSHLVNLDFVTKVLREDGGFALLKGGYKVPISRKKKDKFIAALKERASFL